jgi:hypothetical protein
MTEGKEDLKWMRGLGRGSVRFEEFAIGLSQERFWVGEYCLCLGFHTLSALPLVVLDVLASNRPI